MTMTPYTQLDAWIDAHFDEQVRFLQTTGCELLQGYHFARPMHASEVEQSLARGVQGRGAA